MDENRAITITAWGQKKEQYVDKLIGYFDKLIKEFDYIAICKEDTDIKTGRRGRIITIFAKEILKEITKTMVVKYAIDGIGELQNIFKIN